MADTNNNINIDISGDTAKMATDYGLSGVSLGDAHVGISKWFGATTQKVIE